MSYKEKAVELALRGLNAREIADAIGEDYSRVRHYLQRQRQAGKIPKYQTTEFVKRPEKKEKVVVVENLIPAKHDAKSNEKTIIFGLMGDTQFGSKYAQITHLRKFYDLLSERGITTCYHTGDITDGLKMRPGHEYELYEVSVDEMVADVVKNYPVLKNGKTYFITGNHDASLYKLCGYDIGAAIARDRADMVYLGRDTAVIQLTDNCSLELRHPWDGTAYAISYKVQKMVEAMDSKTKPSMLAIGHYHKAEYIFYRSVHVLQTGAFQSQTPFTRGKGISVHMGGWIVTVDVNDEGYITRIVPEFIPFYDAIPEDYKNYK
jgi:UDP-2,3-diacylglucosamine pyrophosphatase LpxH